MLQLKDADVGMTIVFSDDDTGTNTHMTVTHDGQPPQTFTINKSFAVEKGDLQAAIVGSDQDPKAFDLVGRRPVPDITPGELFDRLALSLGFNSFFAVPNPRQADSQLYKAPLRVILGQTC